MTENKTVLIVFAHQEAKSFNGALKDVAIETLRGQGHDVIVSDLYEMEFDPSASKRHFKGIQENEDFDFQKVNKRSYKEGSLPDAIKQETDKMLSADLIILQFPMYWLGLPAILKGWIDRCFVDGLAFDTDKHIWFDNGPFVDKKIVLSFTTGGTASFFSNKGIFGDMDALLWPVQNALRFTGFQVLPPQISYAPGAVPLSTRQEYLSSWQRRLEHIWTEQPIQFIHVDHFKPENGFEMSEDSVQTVFNGKTGPNIGQNLGRCVPNSISKVTAETNGTH